MGLGFQAVTDSFSHDASFSRNAQHREFKPHVFRAFHSDINLKCVLVSHFRVGGLEQLDQFSKSRPPSSTKIMCIPRVQALQAGAIGAKASKLSAIAAADPMQALMLSCDQKAASSFGPFSPPVWFGVLIVSKLSLPWTSRVSDMSFTVSPQVCI